MMTSPLIPAERIIPASHAGSKRAVMTGLAMLFHALDEDQVLEAVMAREKLGSTGIGYGVAIPHARLKGLSAPLVAVARHHDGIDFDAIDGEPVFIVVMLLVPEDSTSEHLKLLARFARALQQEAFRSSLLQAADAEAMAQCFVDAGFVADG